MTAFRVKGTYYKLTFYFDVWNKEIVGYELSARKGAVTSYYDGLNQVLERIKKEQTEDLITLHTDQGSVYSSESYNKLIENYNIQHSINRTGTPTDNSINESLPQGEENGKKAFWHHAISGGEYRLLDF